MTYPRQDSRRPTARSRRGRHGTGPRAALLAAALFLLPPAAAPAQAAGTDPEAPEMPPVGAVDDAAFQAWLKGVAEEAAARGVSRATLDRALPGLSPIERVIELDRRQPEFTMTLDRYLRNVVSQTRIDRGRRLLAAHRDEIEAIAARHGVQPRYLVALWGIETNFGSNTGGFQVIPALATLAYEGRRAEFFRKQLMDALVIMDRQDMEVAEMKGSWAGAMGQVQFMPSTYMAYAHDGDGDGDMDIWEDRVDALSSAANYLSSLGWDPGETWGRPVRLPKGFDTALAENKVYKGLNEWQEMGVRRPDGSDLPSPNLRSRILLPSGPDGPAYVVYGNFDRILNWNRSNFFGIAVGKLSDRIGGR